METPDSDRKLASLGSPSVDDDCRHADGSRRTGSSPSPDLDDGMGRRSTTDAARPTAPRATAGTRSGVAGSSAGYLTDGDHGFAKGRRTDRNRGDNQTPGKCTESSTACYPSVDTGIFLTRSGKHRSGDSSASNDSVRTGELPKHIIQTASKRSHITSTPEEKIELKHLREELNLLLKQYKRESELLPVSILRELQQSPPSIDLHAVHKPLTEKVYLQRAVEKARKKIELVRRQSELTSESEIDASADDSSCITDTDDMLSRLYGNTATKGYQTRLMPSVDKERATVELVLQRLRVENQDLRDELDVRVNALEHDLRSIPGTEWNAKNRKEKTLK